MVHYVCSFGVVFLLLVVTILNRAFSESASADMMADSPVIFPETGALPAKYPIDLAPKESETLEDVYYMSFGNNYRSPVIIGILRDVL